MRDATIEGELTASRVGGLLVDMCDELAALPTSVTSEASARSGADALLQQAIDNEATARSNADTALSGDIDVEAQTRRNADGVLQTNINSEASARANGDIATVSQDADEVKLKNAAGQTIVTLLGASGGTGGYMGMLTRTDKDKLNGLEATYATKAEMLAANAEQNSAINAKAAASDLTAETTRATDAEDTINALAASALATALGAGTQDTYDVPMKRRYMASNKHLVRLLNTQLLAGTLESLGLTQYYYGKSGAMVFCFAGGLNETGYPTNAQRGCVQVVFGNCKRNDTVVDDLDHDWQQGEGVPNGVGIDYTDFHILKRTVSYPGNVRTISGWTVLL